MALLAGLLPCAARADTGLAILCTDATQAGVQVNARTCATQRYDHPQATDLVRVDSAAVLGAPPNWTRSTFVWKRWDALATGELYETCTTDIPAGTPGESPGVCVGWAFAAKGGGYTHSEQINDPAATGYVLNGLSGTTQVVVTAFNSAGNESAPSSPAT